MSYTSKIYRKPGGDELVVASGGVITVESGGEIELQTGAILQVNASNLDVAELAYLDGITAGAALASKALVLGASKEIATITTLTATNINVGAAASAGTLNIYPATTGQGYFSVGCANQGGARIGSLRLDARTQTQIIHIPDAGAVDESYLVQTSAVLSLAEADVLQDVTPGTAAASKTVVLDSALGISGLALTYASLIITSATPATTRLIRSELTVTPATDVAVGSNGSLAAVRGCVTLTTGKSISDGYLYGVQGKLVVDGATIANGSDHACGLLAQISGSGATFTSGHIAGLVVSGQSLPASANVNMIYIETGGATINSAIQFNCRSTYLFDINNFESCGIVATAGSGGTGSAGYAGGAGIPTRVLKVYVDGAVAYLPLYSTNA